MSGEEDKPKPSKGYSEADYRRHEVRAKRYDEAHQKILKHLEGKGEFKSEPYFKDWLKKQGSHMESLYEAEKIIRSRTEKKPVPPSVANLPTGKELREQLRREKEGRS